MADQPTFASAARWSVVISAGQQGTLLALNLLLARLVGPEAFGLVAMATVFVIFVQLLLQQGLMPAIIQRPDLRPEHLDTAFWLVMGSAVVLTAGAVAASGLWADLNGEPDLAPLICALALTLPLRGLALVQEALLRRGLEFKPLALRTGLAMFTGAAVALMLAYAGAGAWSLVGQQVVTAAVEVLVLWQVGTWRPSWRFSRARARELLGFSGGATLASVGVFANTRADAMVTGLFFGPVAVGWYRLGSRLTTVVIDLASRSLQQAALPELARVQASADRLRDRTLDVLHLSAVTALPVLGVLAACAGPLLALLGPEWAGARPGTVLLCWWAGAVAVSLMTGAVLQATGRPYVLAGLQWVTAVVSCVALIVVGISLEGSSTSRQVAGVALSRAVLYGTLLLAANAAVLRWVAGIRVWHQASRVLPAAAAGLGAFVAGRVAEPVLGGPPLVDLVATALVAGGAAAALLLLLDPRARTVAVRARHLAGGSHAAGAAEDRPTTPTPSRPEATVADGPLPT